MSRPRFHPALQALLLVAAAGCGDDTVVPAGGGPGGDAPRGPATTAPEPVSVPRTNPGFEEVAVVSGINFFMEFLATEQGENFKINLYDHGCGVAIADYDGDGDDDVYLVNQLGENRLFQNDGRGHFKDSTDKAGVGLGDRICVAATFADADNDGDQDLYVTSSRGGNVYFRNEGKGKFTDVTEEAGLTLVTHSMTPAFFDYDRDGDLDLLVTNTALWTLDTRDPSDQYFLGVQTLWDLVACPVEANNLYRNDGTGHFEDVTEAAGMAGPGWGGDISTWDFDGDGWQDVLVSNMFGASTLMRNLGDGTFEDVAWETLGRTSWGAVGSKVFDYDGDGLLDFYLADMHSDMWTPTDCPRDWVEPTTKYDTAFGPLVEHGRMTESDVVNLTASLNIESALVVFGSSLFRSLGGGKFEETSAKAGLETFWPWGIAAEDFDQDGDVDVFIASGMGFPFIYWRSPLMINQGDGTFVDRGAENGFDPPPGGRMLERRIGAWEAARSSRSVAVGDLNGDGMPDMVVNNFNDRAFLWMNRFPPRNHVSFRLQGSTSNRDGIGAVITVVAGGRTLKRVVQSSNGYIAQSSLTQHFGLGDATELGSVEVLWPSGIRQTVEGAQLGQVNHVVEPAPPVAGNGGGR